MNIWKTIDSAPKTGKPFLAWYESKFGPPFGTMKWEPEPKGDGGRFYSMTMGTQTKCATHWMDPEAPRIWGFDATLSGSDPNEVNLKEMNLKL